MGSWAEDAVFYHIYPLGALGAPRRNDPAGSPVARLRTLHRWLDELVDLGITAIYLGPVFESTAHGYDTVDYFRVDRRLGENGDLRDFVVACHRRGIRLVLDAVLNHVGRDFPAFRDVLAKGSNSEFCDWFHLDFSKSGPEGAPFAYLGWSGNYDLVKLNTSNAAVRRHLLEATRFWIEEFAIDGLRLDAVADIEHGFLKELSSLCRGLRPDFWLMGEVVAGNFRTWANPEMLDSVTNFELYKALFSSHNDKNYFELAYTLKRQSATGGLYPDLALYTFADNHDVDRVASSVINPAHLFPLYGLLFTAPGIPSIYYGSEYGLLGRRTSTSDTDLRPEFDPIAAKDGKGADLRATIGRFIALRQQHDALRHGTYEPLHVAHEQFAFVRSTASEQILVAANAGPDPVDLPISLGDLRSRRLADLLDGREPQPIHAGNATLRLYPSWLRAWRIER